MSLYPHKKTNPNHHNAGRVPNYNQSRTQHLAFAIFQLRGFRGHLGTVRNLLRSDIQDERFKRLPLEDRDFVLGLVQTLANLQSQVEDIEEQVVEYNATKTNLSKERLL